MTKTDELVKVEGTTMFFPKIIVTREEMELMWNLGQIRPSWLKTVVSNYDEFQDIVSGKRGEGTSKEQYSRHVNMWSNRPRTVMEDVVNFSDGKMDLIDMVVKYGVSHKQCRQFAKDVLAVAGYGVDVDGYWKQHKKHAQKNTTVAIYGVEHTAMLDDVQEKRKATNRERYGADNPMQNDEIREKLRTRIKDEYGVDYMFQTRSGIPAWQKRLFACLTSDEQWARILGNVCRNAGIPFDYKVFDETLPVSRRDFIISELNNDHVESLIRLWVKETGRAMEFPGNALFRLPFAFSKTWLKHYQKMGILNVPEHYYQTCSSICENHMEQFLDDLGVHYIHNHKKALDGLEMDFYIPDRHIGIEINPNISHNSNLYATEPTRSMFESRKEPSYHYDKYRKAKAAGITLIQLFANDIEPSVFEHITSKRLEDKLCGYREAFHGRETRVVQLTSEADRKKARDFMDLYHTQGSCRASCYWAFIKDGRWLGVASFSEWKEEGCMELKRLCFEPGIQVVGGLSKLMSHFFRAHPEFHAVYSYSDNSIGNGEGYRKAGAEFVKETGPALKFISPKDGRDSYSWQIATSWGAEGGVIGTDCESKGIDKPQTQDEINEYIERELSHRMDDGKGYDRIYTPGSKLWKFTRK